MKKTVSCIIIAFVVLMMGSVQAEGLLPSLTETVGVAMPSMGEALQRYPDSETENDDGSVTELYSKVTETDFNTFSVYLEEQGAELADYQVEGSVMTAEIQAKGASFSLSYDSKTGEVKVTYPSGTFDERMKSAKAHFDAAHILLDEGKESEAYFEIRNIPQFNDYKPVDDKLALQATLVPYKTVGSIVAFGNYEQDNTIENGKEPIEWIVLDVQKDKALLLSKYALEAHRYDSNSSKNNSWEKSEIRKWLNSDFCNAAFSKKQQKAIQTTNIDNSANSWCNEWKANGGKNTQDKVFLLSYADVNKYFERTGIYDYSIEARVSPTAFALAHGADDAPRIYSTVQVGDINYETSEGRFSSRWWLRSPGNKDSFACCVGFSGDIRFILVGSDYDVVRPAIWLDLKIVGQDISLITSIDSTL